MTKQKFIALNTVELNEHLKAYHDLMGRMELAVITAIRDERENALRDAEYVLADAVMAVRMNRLAVEIDTWNEDDANIAESTKLKELAEARYNGMRTIYRMMNNGKEWKASKHQKLMEWYDAWLNEWDYWKNLNTLDFSAE